MQDTKCLHIWIYQSLLPPCPCGLLDNQNWIHPSCCFTTPPFISSVSLHSNHRCQLLPKMWRHQPIILCLVLLAWTRCEVTGVSICENVSNKSNSGSVFPPPQKDKRSLPAAVLCIPDNHSCANGCSKTTHCLKMHTCSCLELNSQFFLSSPSRITELLPVQY